MSTVVVVVTNVVTIAVSMMVTTVMSFDVAPASGESATGESPGCAEGVVCEGSVTMVEGA